MVKTKFDRVVKHRFHLAIRKIFLMNLLLFNGLMCKSQLSFIYNTGVFKSYNNKDIIYSKLDNRFYVLKDNSLSCFNAITNQLIYKTFSPDFIRLNYSTSFHLLTTDDKYLIAGGYPCYSVFELKTGEFVGTFNRFPNYNIKTKEFYIVGDTYDSLAATKNRIVKNVSANERSLLIKLFDPRESFVTYDYLIDTMGNITGTVRERNPAEYSYKEDFIIRYYNNLCLMIQLTDMTPFTKQFVIYDTLTKEVVRRDTLYNELYKLKLFFVNNRIIYQNHSGELILVHISDLSVETIDIDNYLVDFVSSFNENGIIFWQGANYFIHEFGKYGVTHATLKIDNLKQFRVFNIQMEVDSIYYHDNIRVHSKIDENTYIGSINYGDGHGAIHAGTTVIIDIKRNIIKPRIFSSECLVDPITSFCVGTDGLLYLNNKKLFHFSDTEIPKYIFKNI